MRVFLNGETKDLPAELSVLGLVEKLALRPERVAVELNGVVVPRTAWTSTVLGDDDRVEIVHFVGGGGI
ncbi:MAG TPA: sulfur carrier protein ThiS [Pyrinomonadaceae bacterium]|nr:sulfur carrier protein ThiS [Pyrinomonadaceae bacterium]